MEAVNTFLYMNFWQLLLLVIFVSLLKNGIHMKDDNLTDEAQTHLVSHIIIKILFIISIIAYMAYGDDPSKVLYWSAPAILGAIKLMLHFDREEEKCSHSINLKEG